MDNRIVMKTKLITALLAFSTTFGSTVAVSSFFKTETSAEVSYSQQVDRATRRKILRLLQQDIANGTERDRQVWKLDDSARPPKSSENLNEYAKIIENYVDASASLDDSDLPAEFQTAWRSHMKIWREHSNFLAQLKNQEKREKIGAKTEAELYALQDAEITATWYETLRIAHGHGAFPYGAY